LSRCLARQRIRRARSRADCEVRCDLKVSSPTFQRPSGRRTMGRHSPCEQPSGTLVPVLQAKYHA
jgi:hypothetical protein